MTRAQINGTMLNYRLDGPAGGETVMLSNSLAANLDMWKFQVPPLTDAGYRVLRYDGRGHGQSASSPGPYSMEMLARDAVGLIDFLGLEKVHFCGISLGGMVGQMLGAYHGNRLSSLILCATASYLPFPEIWDERIEATRRGGMAALVDATLDRWFTQDGRRRLQREIDEIRTAILNTSVDGYCGCGWAIRGMDFREAIRNISARTLIIVGEQDQGTPVSEAEFIGERIVSSVVRVIPGAAHLVNVEQADRFNAAVLELLDQPS